MLPKAGSQPMSRFLGLRRSLGDYSLEFARFQACDRAFEHGVGRTRGKGEARLLRRGTHQGEAEDSVSENVAAARKDEVGTANMPENQTT
jgi:hypothetical protein